MRTIIAKEFSSPFKPLYIILLWCQTFHYQSKFHLNFPHFIDQNCSIIARTSLSSLLKALLNPQVPGGGQNDPRPIFFIIAPRAFIPRKWDTHVNSLFFKPFPMCQNWFYKNRSKGSKPALGSFWPPPQ